MLVAEDAVVLKRPIGGMVHKVEVPRAGVAGFEREAQPLFTLAQCLFDLLTFGNVAGNVNTSGEFSFRIMQWRDTYYEIATKGTLRELLWCAQARP